MEVTMKVTMEVRKLLNIMTGECSRRELQQMLNLKNADHFRKAYLLPSIEAGLLEMTLQDKPQSSLQKYRLTEKGKTLQKSLGDKTGGIGSF
jgi:ATP-dependent DNA helicase RecG